MPLNLWSNASLVAIHLPYTLQVHSPPSLRFLHPLHNFSLVSYNPRELPPEARCLIRPAQLSPSPLQRGESVTLACITKELRVMQRKSNVTNATFSLSVQEAEVPR